MGRPSALRRPCGTHLRTSPDRGGGKGKGRLVEGVQLQAAVQQSFMHEDDSSSARSPGLFIMHMSPTSPRPAAATSCASVAPGAAPLS